ncbi:MAG: dihydrolipoyl dehydrogenase [Phycisphaeraceae bacterium]
MAETHAFDVVFIGGGPAGYVGAIRAGQLGLKVACIERGQLGGVCNTWGCIPTKALLAAAEFYSKLKHQAKDFGIEADNIRHDFAKVIARSRQVASLGDKGIAGLFKKNNVAHFSGHAKIIAAPSDKAPGKIEVHKVTAGGESSWDIAANAAASKSNQLEHTITARHIILATGAIARQLPGAEFDSDKIIGSKDAMNLKEQPKELVIVGAGAIGMEFAYFYNAFGTKVTVIEMMDRLLPIEDHDVSKAIEKAFRKQKIDFLTAHKTTNIKKTDGGVEVTVAPVSPGADEKKTQTIKADKVLIAIGVRGRYDGLFDPKQIPLEIFKDHIKVDRKNYQTNLKGIYAVGDVNGPPWLAHVASEEAVVCVEQIAGHHPTPIDYDSIPGCTYCHPQVASIGFTEQACKDKGIAYKAGTFPLLASGKARALGETEGFIKVITGERYGEILGCHMIGENVTELIAEIGLARRLEATAEEIIATIHAHPTLSEAVHEATLGTQGRMLHY